MWKLRYLGDFHPSNLESGQIQKGREWETGRQTVYRSKQSGFPDTSFPWGATPRKALGMQAVPKSCLEKFPSLQHLTSIPPVKLNCLAMQAHRGNMFLPHIKMMCSFLVRGTSTKARTHLNWIKLGHICSPISLFCFLVHRYICADRKAYTTA